MGRPHLGQGPSCSVASLEVCVGGISCNEWKAGPSVPVREWVVIKEFVISASCMGVYMMLRSV